MSSAAGPTPFVPDRRRGLLLAILTSAVWGTVPFGGRVALEGMSAPALSTVRLLFGALFIAAVVARRTGGLADLRRPSWIAIPAGLLLGANYSLYMWGLAWAGPVVSQVLIQTAQLFLVALSVAFLGERPAPRHLLGAAVALAGAVMVTHRAPADDGAAPLSALPGGAVLIVLAAVAWAGYAVLHKVLGRERGSGSTMAWIFLVAAAVSAPVALAGRPTSLDGVEVAAVVFLCANSIVAYWAFAEALRHLEASLVAVICTLGPVVTVACSAAFNAVAWERLPHDPLTPWTLGGTVLVLGGVVLAVTARRG